jgi:hypothetical protein
MTMERLTAELKRQLQRQEAMELAMQAAGVLCHPDELDTNKGNPKIHFHPKGVPGEFKGKLASEAPPDVLDAYAKALDYFSKNPKPIDPALRGAEREEALKKRAKGADYNRQDARRCRSWAFRKRIDGWRPPEPPVASGGLDLGVGLGDSLPAAGLPEVEMGDGSEARHDSGGVEEVLDTKAKAMDSDLAGPWDDASDEDDLDGLPE